MTRNENPVTQTARGIDHLVLVATDLDNLRMLYSSLGFTVAPNGRHPFGTENINIYLRDGTMIESLAVADAEEYAAAIEADNTFVLNDDSYRKQFGNNGFSQIVATTNDATADDRLFRDTGVSGGSIVNFTRVFENPDGIDETLSVRLAFARDADSGGAFFFTCQEIVSPDKDNADLMDHENGAQGIAGVVCCAANPEIESDVLKALYGPSDSNNTYHTATGTISVMAADQIAEEFGIATSLGGAAFLHAGFVLSTHDLGKTTQMLSANNVEYHWRNNRIVIPRQDPRSAFIGFEQA